MTRSRILLAIGLMLVLAMALGLVGCGGGSCTSAMSGSTSSGAGGSVGGASPPASACTLAAGNGGGGTAGGTYLFIADAGGIQGEVLNPSSGSITVTSNFGTVQVATSEPGSWVVIAQQQYLYSVYPSIGEIYGWAIAGNGTVTPLNNDQPFAASFLVSGTTNGTQAVIGNPAGTLLFLVDPVNEAVHTFQVGTGGGLTEAAITYMPSGFQPYNVATDGLGKYLYVSNIVGFANTTLVAAYSIGSDGTLTPLGSPFASSLMQMQGDSSGNFMIGTQGGLTGDPNLYVATISQTGATAGTFTSVAAFATQASSPTTVAVQPSQGGVLVYSFDSNGGSVEGFQINASNGTLTNALGSPFSISGVFGEFDQNGKYLFVVEDQSGLTSSVMDAYDVSNPNLQTPVASVGWGTGAWSIADTQ